VNLFAAVLQSEELPTEVAEELAEATMGAGKGAEVKKKKKKVSKLSINMGLSLIRVYN
jgi:hypothetical protein